MGGELRFEGMPPLTIIVSGLVLDEPRSGAEPFRLSAEVEQWCDDTLGSPWRLYPQELHFRVCDPALLNCKPIEGKTDFPILQFGSIADEIAFRLRWLGQ